LIISVYKIIFFPFTTALAIVDNSDSDFFDVASFFTMVDSEAVMSSKPTTSRVAGAYGKRRAAASVVPHGHVLPEVCETVFRAAITSWGVSGSSESDRDELMWCIAEVLVHGTSSEIDWEQVSFTYKGTVLTMAPFFDVAVKHLPVSNPVRVWVRDFRKAEIAVRISELLNTAENIEMRQVAAANYGTTIAEARFCFDTSHALFHSGMVLGHSDMQLISKLAAAVINRAHDDGVSRGFAQATSNHAGTVGGSKPTPQVSPTPTTTAVERGGFKPLR
jgi:hypothetical protein